MPPGIYESSCPPNRKIAKNRSLIYANSKNGSIPQRGEFYILRIFHGEDSLALQKKVIADGEKSKEEV
jgi:hypothetical protein